MIQMTRDNEFIFINTGEKNIMVHYGYYWILDNEKLNDAVRNPNSFIKRNRSDGFSDIITYVEDNNFASFVFFEKFGTFNIIIGTTQMEPGVYFDEIPLFEQITTVEEDVKGQIFGWWRNASVPLPNAMPLDILYNEEQEVMYYVIYINDNDAIIISPMTTFELHIEGKHDVISFLSAFKHAHDPMKGIPYYTMFAELSNKKVLENILKQFNVTNFIIKPASQTMFDFLQKQIISVPFLDGEVPIYFTMWGFYKGHLKDAREVVQSSRITRDLEELLEETYYKRGDYEIKLFKDYKWAVRYKEWLALPCCLLRLKEPVSIDKESAEKLLQEVVISENYTWTSTDPIQFLSNVSFFVPDPSRP